jgi:hypothetical protein
MEDGASEVELEREQNQCLKPYLVEVNTKYKIVEKNVRPAAVPLPVNAKEMMEMARAEHCLRDQINIGHECTNETIAKLKIGDGLLTEIKAFKDMVLQHGKALAFSIKEIERVDPRIVTPMIIFTIPHLPWNLKPILVPRALLPNLMELLKEKMEAKILERSSAPYSNRWFTVTKNVSRLFFWFNNRVALLFAFLKC